MARWSLRTRLVLLVAVALLPVLGLAAWQGDHEQQAAEKRRSDAVATAAELAVARHRELIEGSRRLLVAACSADAVQKSATAEATQSDITSCEVYLSRVLKEFPAQYSSLLVTDAKGVARCSSTVTSVGMGFSDREIFRQVQDTKQFSIGPQSASRVTSLSIVPLALPILRDGEFGGMCAIGISLRNFADAVSTTRTAGGIAVALVDRSGGSIGGAAEMVRALPVSARVTAAIVGGQSAFRDYGQDGTLYDFSILPLVGTGFFVVAAAPVTEGFLLSIFAWDGLVLVGLALVIALVTVWFGADRWCVRPLRYIQGYAEKVARGEIGEFVPRRPWTPEMAAVSAGVATMAEAITSREAELKAAVELRDHMLREIHHRVKNNLQMISSLLNLQAGEIRSPRLRRFFGDAQNRVLTLSILHRHLYERTSWALVDFQRFISDLVRQISVGSADAGGPSPRFHIRAPIMAVGPDVAIPVGLIVTEVVSRALDHDFDGVAAPELRIEAAENGGEVTFVIEDNGVENDAGPVRPGGGQGVFGLTLVRGLAMQLGGEVTISPRDGGGTRVVLTFPMADEETADA
jgi:two-component sensor histidine kinase